MPAIGTSGLMSGERKRNAYAVTRLSSTLQLSSCTGALNRRKFFCDKAFLARQRSSPVPTECNPTLFEIAPVDGRQVVAAFDGGAITSDAGALLLGETDRALCVTARFAACFTDGRARELVEHEVATMVL